MIAVVLRFGRPWTVLALVVLSACRSAVDPESWSKTDRTGYLGLESSLASSVPGAGAPAEPFTQGMVAGSTNPFAVHAGLEMLKSGASAADAALTTALTQVALSAGAAVSYAGILKGLYYDANSQTVYSLNAAWNTLQNEKDPLTIPGPQTSSGRSVLVSGLMAGVEALHGKFGRKRFATMFEPAIWIAEHGFPLEGAVDSWLQSQRGVLSRLDETSRIFTKPNREFYQTGDQFRQPELAVTLRQVAKQGAPYMYTGEWARRFVEIVGREGGKVTLDDMARYQPIWSAPSRVTYHGHDVVSLGEPSFGGIETLASLITRQV